MRLNPVPIIHMYAGTERPRCRVEICARHPKALSPASQPGFVMLHAFAGGTQSKEQRLYEAAKAVIASKRPLCLYG